MNALLLLTVANIKSFTRDRAALFWTLAFPLIFVVLFGSIFSGGTSQRTIGFADLDASAASAKLKGVFSSATGVTIVDGSQDDLLAQMRSGEVSAVVVVPKGYAETVAAKAGPAQVTVYTDPSQSSADAGTRQLIGFVLAAVNQEATGQPPAVVPAFEAIQTNDLTFISYLVPSILGMSLMQLGVPDHEPNPLLEENRRMIIERVRSTGADLGIAWDGDADRCFFIDGNGSFCDGDFICALLARSVLQKNPGATILYDPRSSRAVPDLVAAEGGRSDLSRVGHAFFKARMREEGAAFGGEVSGHYYFRDFWNADSGTIPALLVLELLSLDGRTLGELMEEFRSKYFISGEINSEVDDAGAKIKEIEERYSDGELSHLDGVSVDYEDWHFNVRPSNTEPLLRLNLESLVSREDMERRRDEVLGLIRS